MNPSVKEPGSLVCPVRIVHARAEISTAKLGCGHPVFLEDSGAGAFPGGRLGVVLARAFRIIDPSLKHPRTEHWQCSFQIFDLLL
jgi:hypothetical protein